MIAALLLLQSTVIGVWDGWGALRDPTRCWAVARPQAVLRDSDAHASVGVWPGRGVDGQVSLRLSRERSADAPVVLAVAGRRFRLVARGRDVWAPDADADRAIVAAMRRARGMAVESRDTRGRRFADGYALAGAPTAIDAARVACR